MLIRYFFAGKLTFGKVINELATSVKTDEQTDTIVIILTKERI